MTAKQLTALIGKQGMWKTPLGVTVPVEILDARSAYGRIEMKVKPVGGKGEVWARNVTVK